MNKVVKELKKKFKKYDIDGYVVPKNDDYFTEYSKINRLKIQYFGDELNHIDIKEIACQLAKEIRT